MEFDVKFPSFIQKWLFLDYRIGKKYEAETIEIVTQGSSNPGFKPAIPYGHKFNTLPTGLHGTSFCIMGNYL